ncbi:hypothetical protein [Amycolatopsis cihanbeyliensis]|uniref:hypothetical protein n=1 Tax=Amycolatopsis cihanbeyliensis TaxID=1128664 RepID=UPI00115312BE|nr:hypothetical protein [Amycolatopsis cihanbeyliensis]
MMLASGLSGWGWLGLRDLSFPGQAFDVSLCRLPGGSDCWAMVGGDARQLNYYGMTGSFSRPVMSGRLSFAFDLRGPTRRSTRRALLAIGRRTGAGNADRIRVVKA